MSPASWKWPLVQRRIALGDKPGGKTLALSVVADPDAVLDDAVENEKAGRGASLPYWASLWPSGIELARWALANVQVGQRVLDLGCGMGVVGVAAGMAGGHVTVADIEPEAVELAVRNTGGRGIILDLAKPNLAEPKLDETFDLILGGDLLYERQIAEPLWTFLRGHLAEGGRAVLADPHRDSAEVFLAGGRCEVQQVAGTVRLIHIQAAR